MTSLGDLIGANKVFFICGKLLDAGVHLDGDYIITQRRVRIKYTNVNLKYCIEKLFYTLKYEAEEDEVSDLIFDFKYIFDNELIEEESESEEEEEDNELSEGDELVDAQNNDFLVNALLKINK